MSSVPPSPSNDPEGGSRLRLTDPDADMAAAAVGGDAASVRRLWEANRRWVAAILLAHKPRWADLDDLLQEVALAMVRKIGELRDPGALRPWLRTVAINAAHAEARGTKRRAGQKLFAEESQQGVEGRTRDFTPAPEALGDHEHGRLLMQLAFDLPDGYREPLLLKAVEGLSYRQIGEIMDLPETTIETRVARGRRMLRESAARTPSLASLQ
ncbi:MAG: sigma-70 family RNA polymerase sigma factor [Phycisphaerae bacterium]|jgi:RNA polymerase sigma-70 factor (ECF subfamily)